MPRRNAGSVFLGLPNEAGSRATPRRKRVRLRLFLPAQQIHGNRIGDSCAACV